MKNPNKNCLAGKKCPKCSSFGPFKVSGNAFFILYDDGTDGFEDVYFSEKSYTICLECRYFGKWGDFDKKGRSTGVFSESLEIKQDGRGKAGPIAKRLNRATRVRKEWNIKG